MSTVSGSFVTGQRKKLLALRERVTASRDAHTLATDDHGEINSAAGDQHLADHATETFDRELDESLEENAEHVLQEIDDALKRIDEGTYGLCSACGDAIPRERLQAVPYATLCLDDKRRQEHP